MLKCALFLSLFISCFASEKKPQGISYDWHVPTNYEEASSWTKIAAYQLASYLTDPVCKAREYVIRFQILQDLAPSDDLQELLTPLCSYVKKMQLIDESWLNPEKVTRYVEQSLLLSGAASFAAIAPFTALPAIALRFAASHLETNNFIHYKGFFKEKELEGSLLTHMLWNICGIKAGYDIEEGGQMPIQDDFSPYSQRRIFKIAAKILEEDPDLLSLNEVFDIKDAIYLVDALQDRYSHFIIQCGTRSIGPSSGLFFASKFAVDSIAFTPFPKEMLEGNGKYAEKGFLSVQICDSKGLLLNCITTHLQHSDQPEFPTDLEKNARKQELNLIFQSVSPELTLLLAGDLNLEDKELAQINPDFYSLFQKTLSYTSSLNEEPYTWLGDKWYVEYGNRESSFSFLPARKEKKREISQGLNLDHVLLKGNSANQIHTILKTSGYDPQKISKESLSDHCILLSNIHLQR